MTDRLKGCYVAFDDDYRTDDVERILEAIRMVRGVASIATTVTNGDDWMNRERIRREYEDKVLAVFSRK